MRRGGRIKKRVVCQPIIEKIEQSFHAKQANGIPYQGINLGTQAVDHLSG